MIIGHRLRELRERESLSQGEIEQRTGLLRCYISRVENGHTIPSLQTLEKLSLALGVPLYEIFMEGAAENPAQVRGPNGDHPATDNEFRFMEKVKGLVSKIEGEDRRILLYMARKLAQN